MFCPSLRGDAVPLLRAGMGGKVEFTGSAWQLCSFPDSGLSEALRYFVRSVVSPVSPQPSISIPRHRCMLNDVLIICHFRLSALESSEYTKTYANTLFSLGMPSIYSDELPTIPCYGSRTLHFHKSHPHFGLFSFAGPCLVGPSSSFWM